MFILILFSQDRKFDLHRRENILELVLVTGLVYTPQDEATLARVRTCPFADLNINIYVKNSKR